MGTDSKISGIPAFDNPLRCFAVTEERSIHREDVIHGSRWASLHDGYFSSHEIASQLIDSIEFAIGESHPSVIADLGGGTGFILGEMLRRLDLHGAHLVNMEISEKQIACCTDSRIVTLQKSAAEFIRSDLVADDGPLLLISRSLLHYFGRSGLLPLLRHIRDQLRPGELFVHQSCCFQRQIDACCMNHIYDRMQTGKWFFTAEEMSRSLKMSGLEVCSSTMAPEIHLVPEDLSVRYGLGPEQIESIFKDVALRYGDDQSIITSKDGYFDARLHTSIFICRSG